MEIGMKKDLIQILSLFLLGIVCFAQTCILLFGDAPTGVGPLAMVAVLVLVGVLSELVAVSETRRLWVAKRNQAPEQ